MVRASTEVAVHYTNKRTADFIGAFEKIVKIFY